MNPEHLVEFKTIGSGIHLPFILNQGHLDERIQFYTKTFCGSVYVTGDGTIEYRFPARNNEAENLTNHGSTLTQKNINADPLVIEENFISRLKVTIRGEKPAPTRVNYLKGDDANKWQKNLQTYSCVSLGEIYEGIELKLKTYGNNVEKLFYVKPGANPENIKVKLKGILELRMNEAGELEARSEYGKIKFTKPVAYQQDEKKTIKNIVEVAYTVNNDEYGFTVGEYDPDEMLVIDPLLASTFVGGSGDEISYAVALDPQDNVYVVGGTNSVDFTSSDNRAKSSDRSDWDVFIAKFDKELKVLDALTFLGGSEDERAYSIVLDDHAQVYITGLTGSADFPTTAGVFGENFNGYRDGFIARLSADLTTLQASTFIGSSGFDGCYSLTLDEVDRVYVTGTTFSADFPTTPDVFDTSYNNKSTFWLPGDAFISRFDNNLKTIAASTYLGGSGFDWGQHLAYFEGSVYLAGETKLPGSTLMITNNALTNSHQLDELLIAPVNRYNLALRNLSVLNNRQSRLDKHITSMIQSDSEYNDFPVTPGVLDENHNGETDIFVSRFNANLTKLEASTLLGGRRSDFVGGFDVDAHGNLYVVGSTLSFDFPSTEGAFDESYNGFFDGYISQLKADLTDLHASTFLGGTDSDVLEGLVLKGSGYVYVAGYSTSPDIPIPFGSQDSTLTASGEADIFISRLNASLSSNLASTFLGGSDQQNCNAIAVNRYGNVYVSGTTRSSDYPSTDTAFDNSFNGGTGDVFITIIDRFLSDEENRFWNTTKLLFYPVYPNPFNDETTIQFDLPNSSAVTIEIYNLTGKKVWELSSSQIREPGLYQMVWNGRDMMGMPVSSGQYFCRVTTNAFNETRKLILLK